MTAPSRPREVKKDLEQVLLSLIDRGLVDDQNFPILRRVSRTGWEVSFDGAHHLSMALSDIDYDELHREFTTSRSYNAKLIDGGLLQLMYRFQGEQLLQHRLAYYPSPFLRSFRDNPEFYFRDELFIEIVSRRIVPFPLRFDFDQGAARDIEHPRCHLTLGDVGGCRIPVSAPMTPRWFVEFVVRNFYQTDHHDFVARLPGHLLHFEPTISDNERRLVHVVVPAV